MAGCGGKKKVKKYDMGGMAKVKPVPEGLLKEGGKRLADERRRMMMKGISDSLRQLRPPMEKPKTRARSRSSLPNMADALKSGRDFAEKMKKLPKDSAEYKRIKKAQEMAGAKMKASSSRGASGMKKGGKVKSHRGDGCAMRGKTKGRMV